MDDGTQKYLYIPLPFFTFFMLFLGFPEHAIPKIFNMCLANQTYHLVLPMKMDPKKKIKAINNGMLSAIWK